jgi:hypothetical protein
MIVPMRLWETRRRMMVWLEGADGAVGDVGDDATSCWRMVVYAYSQ